MSAIRMASPCWVRLHLRGCNYWTHDEQCFSKRGRIRFSRCGGKHPDGRRYKFKVTAVPICTGVNLEEFYCACAKRAAPNPQQGARQFRTQLHMPKESRVPRGSLLYVASNVDSTKSETLHVHQGVFPGGLGLAKLRLPGIVLRVLTDDIVEDKSPVGFLNVLSLAVSNGLTMVILEAGTDGAAAARLYDAACVLKTMLSGRAELLVAERVDVASAAGADGVLLSDEGLWFMTHAQHLMNMPLFVPPMPDK